ncbi:MAG: Gfo/Idh/MocA family oxidoreductase [Proteobacteria bacterium]|nr:Gfo/Idh/MocA family oxidoreductase [Pseudomonadota bacterium]MBI3499922.1 Gfo/Idh/MocA family oxidoreductase [Pseudomonadota bacterium]
MGVMRFGLIGFGAWGKYHAEAILKAPAAELAAIACQSQATEAAARAAYPGLAVHRDWRLLLADPGIDAVDIVLPNDLHAEVGVAALDSGKHVLLAKPMATSLADCDRLIQARRRSGKQLSIGHEFRISSQWGLLKHLLESGELGRPLYANVSLFRFPYRLGSGGWRHDPGRVGSWILEEPVHFFDMLMWYFESLGDPHSVVAFGNAKPRDDGKGGRGRYDNFTALLSFPRGVHAVVTQTLAGFEHHHVVEIVGSEGAARTWWSGVMDRTLEPRHELKVKRRGQDQAETIHLEKSGEVFELEEEIQLTAEAFAAGRALVSAEEARKRIAVCLAAEESVATGRAQPLTF